MQIETVFYILVLIFSVIIHEIAHGVAADKLGDSTARMEGRLSLNPLVHIDPIGSVLLPFLLVISGSPFLVGWAKPVPFNPNNFYQKNWIRKYGEGIVAIAGPLSNLLIAFVFGLILHFQFDFVNISAASLMETIVLVNCVLAVFNLVPVPPLDGSKILFTFLPYKFRAVRDFLERYAFVLALVFIIFLWQYIAPLAVSLAIFFISY